MRTHLRASCLATLAVSIAACNPPSGPETTPTPETSSPTIPVVRVCGRAHPERCIGVDSAAVTAQPTFASAARAAIDAILSDTFPSRLAGFLAAVNGERTTGEWDAALTPNDVKDAWAGKTAKWIVDSLRRILPSTIVETYQDCGAYRRSGNLAYEGTDGAILINRCHLIEGRTTADIANTIAHELSHRIELRHPHMQGWWGRSWRKANCEPPYVIGGIVGNIVDSREPIACAMWVRPN